MRIVLGVPGTPNADSRTPISSNRTPKPSESPHAPDTIAEPERQTFGPRFGRIGNDR